jgi:ADP-ribose pyrophosphatase YjhB (NUDIX family)
MNDVSTRTTLDLLDELRAIAQTGLNFSKDPFDILRYSRIKELVSTEYSSFTQFSSKEIGERFSKELGYVTPKIGVQCAIFNEADELLLEKRKDDGLWGLPSGWVDVGESPEEAITREIKEETSLVLEGLKVIGFYTRLPGQFEQPHASVHILYLCERWHGVVNTSFESMAMEFHDPVKIFCWHKDHKQQAEDALRQWAILRQNRSL